MKISAKSLKFNARELSISFLAIIYFSNNGSLMIYMLFIIIDFIQNQLTHFRCIKI